MTALRARLPRGDRGSMIPMIILCFSVAGVIITGSIAAGGAFLAQRDLESVCDGAAIAGAQALDDVAYYGAGAPGVEAYPLGDVQGRVDDYVARDGGSVTAGANTDGRSVSVTCRETAHVPFGRMFGYGGGLARQATADARPVQAPGG
jgi:uncharacterized membrane protein